MGDSETVVAETSTITEYPSSASHMAVDYNTAGSDGTGEGGDMATGPTSEPTSTNSTDGTYPVPDGSSSVDQSAYGTDPSSVMQEDPISSTHNGETVVGVGGDTGNLVRQENAVQAGHYVASQENVVQAGHYVAIQETTVQDGHYVASQENAAQTGDYVAGQENAVQAGHYVASQENAVQGGHYVAGQENAVQPAHYVASQENAVQAGTYDASMNGNGATEVNIDNSVGHDANGNVLSNAAEAVSEQQYDAGPAISTEEERLWNIVKTNPLDFDAWTALIGETERVAQDNILKIRKIYDAFLAEFPLCYGYWKKYADHEARFGFVDKVVEVYERAVLAVTYSVDIWLHYCTFAKSAYEDPDIVRRLFERGLAYVGTDYLSYPLWDKYIEYEYERLEWSHLATIYTRILESPGQQLDRYFNSFKELAGSRSLSELRTAEEAAAMAAVNSEVAVQQVEGEVRQDGAEHSLKSLGAGLTEAEELEKYVSIREEMYRKAKEFDSKIIGFETAIRRPYFHVHPLKGSELENWHSYLDFIESGDDFNKVVKLYERCLIACANYSEFWTRYVLCMEASGSIELANNALARATQVFVKRQPDIHLFSARFKEQIGDISAARAEYQLVHSGISPGLLEAIVNHANMEYRLGHKEDAFSVYEQAIATEKGKEHSQTLPVLYVQYSRFQSLVAGNVEKAREILDGAADHVQLTKPFLEGLLFLESVQSAPKRMDYIASVVEKFILPNSENANAPSTTDREDISSIYLEFLGLFGDSQSIKKAADQHAKLFLNHRSKSESKKRSAEDYLASDKTKVANSYASIPSPAQPVMGAYPTAQNPWPASYGVQPQSQAYVQAPQAQGQQWNPAYAQQAAYGAYSGYNTTYTQPQAPVSAPQTTAYGAYPQSYPTQTYPQQNYTQPATATAAVAYAQPAAAGAVAYTPAQPQAAAPVSQAYYGTYY